MKRYLHTILFPCLFFHLVIIPGYAISEIIDDMVSVEPRIIIKEKVMAAPKVSFSTYCYDIFSGKKIECACEVTISRAYDESCSGGPDIQCGHNDMQHTPSSRSEILNNNNTETARILGGLTNAWQPTMTTKLKPVSLAGDYHFNYFSGEITGMVSMKRLIYGLPSGWRFVSPCESSFTCTGFTPIFTEHWCDENNARCQRFIELAEPIPPTEENLQSWADGYVRCGLSSNCDVPDNIDPVNWLQYDKPNNWPAHPTTNWGQWQFLFELRILANRWYRAFGKPLVINDISLPRGGLLDTKSNWKTPHSSHRQGIDADILRVSVPTNMRPSGPADRRWIRIYEDNELLRGLNIVYAEKIKDYNHLQYDNFVKIFVLP
ncbi:MAG: penicillin-insensitive murein endopeptidase [Syntrophales bacterium]